MWHVELRHETPGHCRGAHEQGTEPLTAQGAILRGSLLALTSLHTLMNACTVIRASLGNYCEDLKCSSFI